MKSFFAILLYIIVSIQCGYAQNIEQRISSLITSGNYLELNRQYHLYEDSISPFMQAIINPLLSSAFNKHEKAANEIDFLLNNYANELGNTTLSFITMLGQQLYYIGEYKTAANLLNGVIASLKEQNAPNEFILPLETLHKKVYALRDVNKTTIVKYPKISNQIRILDNLKCSNDGWYISGMINGMSEPFLLDTGAGTNVISESFAMKHNVHALLDSILVSGGFGHSEFTKIGVIDSIIIGNIAYNNVVVSIAKDNDILPQSIQDSIGYKIDAILGIDFLKAIGGIIIYPQKKIIEFPQQIEYNSQILPNIMLNDNAPFVECTLNNAKLLLNCDTGLGMEGYITFDSYNRNKEYFYNIDIANKSNTRLGGFAGVNQYQAQKIESAYIGIGNNVKLLQNFNILEKEMLHDGGLGIDYFQWFNKIVIDLINMQLTID